MATSAPTESVTGNRSWRIMAVGLVAVMAVLMASFARNHAFMGDFWEHAAVVRALSRDLLHPAHPVLLVDAPSQLYSPYSWILGLLARLSSMASVDLLAAVSVVNVAALLLALLAFARRIGSHGWSTAALSLPLVLLLWGDHAWQWSGFFHVNALFFVAPYPSTIAATLIFLSLIAALDVVERGRRWPLALLAPATAIVIVTHPPSAITLMVGLTAMVLGRTPPDLRLAVTRAGAVGLAAVIGILLSLTWPLVSLLDIARNSGSFDVIQTSLFRNVPERMWPILVCAPLLLLRLRQSRRDPLALFAMGLGTAYLVGFVTEHYMLGRVISYLAITVQIAAADALAGFLAKKAVRPAMAAAIAFALTVVVATRRSAVRLTLPRANPPGFALDFLREFVGPDDVVITHQSTSLAVPAFAGKVVSPYFPEIRVDDLEARRRATGRFFAGAVTDAERREILERYGVRWLLIDRSKLRPEQPAAERLQLFGAVAHDTGRYVLVRVTN